MASSNNGSSAEIMELFAQGSPLEQQLRDYKQDEKMEISMIPFVYEWGHFMKILDDELYKMESAESKKHY